MFFYQVFVFPLNQHTDIKACYVLHPEFTAGKKQKSKLRREAGVAVVQLPGWNTVGKEAWSTLG